MSYFEDNTVPSINSLQDDAPGYFDITDAYGKGAANCNTQFIQRMCNQ